MSESADDLSRYLREQGLIGAGVRPHLCPNPEDPLVMQADSMEAWLTKEVTDDDESLALYRRALNLVRVGTLYTPYESTAPGVVMESIEALLDLYIKVMSDSITEGEVSGDELIMSLLRLSNMSLRMGYVYRAMEDDGRWEDLDPKPLSQHPPF